MFECDAGSTLNRAARFRGIAVAQLPPFATIGPAIGSSPPFGGGRSPLPHISEGVWDAQFVLPFHKTDHRNCISNRGVLDIADILFPSAPLGQSIPFDSARSGFPFVLYGQSLPGPCRKGHGVLRAYLNDGVVSLFNESYRFPCPNHG